jgi:hypothetical protein
MLSASPPPTITTAAAITAATTTTTRMIRRVRPTLFYRHMDQKSYARSKLIPCLLTASYIGMRVAASMTVIRCYLVVVVVVVVVAATTTSERTVWILSLAVLHLLHFSTVVTILDLQLGISATYHFDEYSIHTLARVGPSQKDCSILHGMDITTRIAATQGRRRQRQRRR